MDEITVNSNAKINLGLNIIRKRDDGYHDLETIFFPIYSLYDVIAFKKSNQISLESNLEGDFNDENNLILKTVKVVSEFTGFEINVNIKLIKKIPIGGGLGGGSSNAAFTLLAINKLFNLNISKKDMEELALKLGSDIPFFLYNKPALAYGRGEILKPLNVSFTDYNLLLINPGIHISTKQAFSAIKPYIPESRLEQINYSANPIKDLKVIAKNDFEEYVFTKYPEISAIKDLLMKKGSIYASMSGTGSTVFGFFEKKLDLKNILRRFPNSYFTHIEEL